jgi:putative DNA primase/helicase
VSVPRAAPRVVDPASNWEDALVRKSPKDPALKACLANAAIIFASHPRWEGVLAYDEFRECLVTLGSPPWHASYTTAKPKPGIWQDEDTSCAVSWYQVEYSIEISAENIYRAAIMAGRQRSFHPVRQYLLQNQWDKVRRTDDLLPRYFGCDDNVYTRTVGSKFLIAAVARIMRPGCKVDTMPILEGEQGGFKSTGFRFLAGDEWYCTITGDLISKDTLQAQNGKWICELDELGALLKTASIEQVKGYMSRASDRYRAPYGRIPRDYPRSSVPIGSTNKDRYLTDETGARRFQPVRCVRPADLMAIRRDRDQLWAETYARFAAGETWHVPRDNEELNRVFREEADLRYQEHPWTERVERWLSDPMAPQRRTKGVTVSDILSDCIGLATREQDTRTAGYVGAILRRLQWVAGKRQHEGPTRVVRWQPSVMPRQVEQPSGTRVGDQGNFFELDEAAK